MAGATGGNSVVSGVIMAAGRLTRIAGGTVWMPVFQYLTVYGFTSIVALRILKLQKTSPATLPGTVLYQHRYFRIKKIYNRNFGAHFTVLNVLNYLRV